MTRSLRSYEDVKERKKVIQRRLRNNTGGLGYLSALAAADVYHIQEVAEAKAAAEEAQANEEVKESIAGARTSTIS